MKQPIWPSHLILFKSVWQLTPQLTHTHTHITLKHHTSLDLTAITLKYVLAIVASEANQSERGRWGRMRKSYFSSMLIRFPDTLPANDDRTPFLQLRCGPRKRTLPLSAVHIPSSGTGRSERRPYCSINPQYPNLPHYGSLDEGHRSVRTDQSKWTEVLLSLD